MIDLLGQAAPTDPTSYSPLAIVASVVAFLLWRLKATDADGRERERSLESQLAASQAREQAKDDELAEQRSLKHAALNREARAAGTLDIVARLAPSCTCGALDPIVELLDIATRRSGEKP